MKLYRSYAPVLGLLFTVMLIVLGREVKGQKVYAFESSHGSTPGAGGAAGTILGSGNIGSIGTAYVNNPGSINGTKNTNSADLITNSGGPGTGLGAGAGTASTAFIIIDFAGSSTPKNGNPIYLKGTATATSSGLLNPLLENPGNRVSLQAYNGITPVGGPILLATLGTNSDGEYLFNAPGDLTSIKITVTTDLGYVPVLNLLAGGVSTASLKLYYAYYVAPPAMTGATVCSGNPAPLSVNSADPALTYNWYDAATGGNLINTGSTYDPILTASATYYVETVDETYASGSRTPVSVIVNPLPTLTIITPAVTIPEATGSLSLQATSNATNVKWYDHSGTLVGSGTNVNILPPATVGIYSYTAIADNSTCSTSATIMVSVFSTTTCPPITQRVYANDASTTSGTVTNAALAADGDPKTGSTLSSALSLLGLGAATQNLSWNTTIAAGTPVTIKFGPGVNLLGLGSGISVIPFKKNGSGITTIGNTLSMNAALLTLLPGTNMLEYTFVPSNTSGVPQTYDGVKITLNALLSLGLTANIYEAYYHKTEPPLDCTKDVLDVLSGAEAPLGIGAATATVNVTNPWGVVDNSGTPTVLTNTIGVGAYAKERIIFSSQSLPGDSLKIVTSVTGTILNLGLLGGFSIQRYLGSSPVGDLIAGNGSLLTLKLLDGGTKAALILAPMAEPYDAIEIRLGNVISVFNSLNLHQIQRIANTKAIGADVNNYIEVCEGTNVVLPTTSCTTFEWYDQPTGGNLVTTGQTLNTTGLTNTKTYYIQPVRYGCKNMPRGILTVKINKPAITLGPSPEICEGENNATLPYSDLSCATNFSISWDQTAALAGFSNLNGTLNGGTISIQIPTGIQPRSLPYNGFLTISNGQSVMVTYSFTVKINAKPPPPHINLTSN